MEIPNSSFYKRSSPLLTCANLFWEFKGDKFLPSPFYLHRSNCEPNNFITLELFPYMHGLRDNRHYVSYDIKCLLNFVKLQNIIFRILIFYFEVSYTLVTLYYFV